MRIVTNRQKNRQALMSSLHQKCQAHAYNVELTLKMLILCQNCKAYAKNAEVMPKMSSLRQKCQAQVKKHVLLVHIPFFIR